MVERRTDASSAGEPSVRQHEDRLVKGIANHGFYTPLRYPGGKGKLASYVARVFEVNEIVGGTYVEPYAGGAAVAMELLLTGVAKRVHINDLNTSVYAFWHSVLRQPEELCSLISKTPVSIETWHTMKEVQAGSDPSLLELGFSTFFLNRTNRSGIIGGGVIGGKNQDGAWKLDARFNKRDLIARILAIADYASSIALHNEDAEKLVIKLAKKIPAKSLIYFDPPYYVKGQGLYLNYYNEKDHAALANTIRRLPSTQKWITSYDDHPALHALYKGYPNLVYTLSYSANTRYRGSEAIFFSKNLIVPAPMPPMKLAA